MRLHWLALSAFAALGPAFPPQALAQSAQPPPGTVAQRRTVEPSAFGGWATNSDVHGSGGGVEPFVGGIAPGITIRR